jgi:hypothetical protein
MRPPPQTTATTATSHHRLRRARTALARQAQPKAASTTSGRPRASQAARTAQKAFQNIRRLTRPHGLAAALSGDTTG